MNIIYMFACTILIFLNINYVVIELIIPSKKRNAPLRHSSIIFNRMNAKVSKFHISYINQSCIDIMKIISIFIVTVA